MNRRIEEFGSTLRVIFPGDSETSGMIVRNWVIETMGILKMFESVLAVKRMDGVCLLEGSPSRIRRGGCEHVRREERSPPRERTRSATETFAARTG